MIYFLTARGYDRTLRPLSNDDAAPKVSLLAYDEILPKPCLPQGTYIFTDFDRLSTQDLIEAARLYQRLGENGCRVLNNPARVRTRFALLRGLFRMGLNPFNVYLAEEGQVPSRFPVFIRVVDGHDSPLSELIHDQAELNRAIDTAVITGTPRSAILIVEYAAEPVRPGVFRKLSIYRIGDRYVTDVNWHGRTWRIKGDQDGIADEDLYEDELDMVRHDTFVKQLQPAFAFANIDYGRADFGLMEGKPCIYEINTNPTLFAPTGHPVAQRNEARKLRWSKLLQAFHNLDSGQTETPQQVDVAGISVEVWDRVPELCSTLRIPNTQISQRYAKMGKHEAALRHAEAAVSTSPNSATALFQLARLLLRQGRLDEGLAFGTRAIAITPRKAQANRRFGALLLEAGCTLQARDHLLQALEFDSSNRETQLLLSRAYWRLGQYWVAVKTAVAASDRRPTETRDKSSLWRLVRTMLPPPVLIKRAKTR